MKKVLLTLVAAIALVFAVQSCGKSTPATELIDKLESIMDQSLKFQNDPSAVLSMTQEDIAKFQKQAEEIEAFAKANKDYVLTPDDKAAFKEFAKKVASKTGEKLTDKDLEEIDEAETLGDLDMF